MRKSLVRKKAFKLNKKYAMIKMKIRIFKNVILFLSHICISYDKDI